MKNKKILAIGLCGAICLSIAGVTYASALASDTPKVSTSETGNTSGADILYQDTDGGQISVDGKNWVTEADYEKNNAAPDVQWWTADEYEAWMNSPCIVGNCLGVFSYHYKPGIKNQSDF